MTSNNSSVLAWVFDGGIVCPDCVDVEGRDVDGNAPSPIRRDDVSPLDIWASCSECYELISAIHDIADDQLRQGFDRELAYTGHPMALYTGEHLRDVAYSFYRDQYSEYQAAEIEDAIDAALAWLCDRILIELRDEELATYDTTLLELAG